MNELTKLIAELKGWKVQKWDDFGRSGYSIVKPGSILNKLFGSEDEALSDALLPLSLLDEVEQAGYRTDLSYDPFLKEYKAIIRKQPAETSHKGVAPTRDEAIFRAWISWAEQNQLKNENSTGKVE